MENLKPRRREVKKLGNDAVADRVKEIIVEQLNVDPSQVTDDAIFLNDLGADSLDMTELVMALEEEFSLKIPDEEVQKITRVKEAIEYIKEHTTAER